ncbi:MAG: TIGR02206 family membrane protein [Oscillospiraceae bacterium]
MDFFSSTTGVPFVLFGPLYFALLIAVVVLSLYMYKFRDKLRKFKHNKLLRFVFSGVLFTNMTVYYVSLMIIGEYDIKKHLPLEFCFITGYILMYILITNNKNNFFTTLFYCTLIGPLPAMIFPNLSGSYDRFIFYQFIISHHFMLLVSFYCVIVFGYKVETKSAIRAFIYGNIVFISVSILNVLWGSNYIMQQKLPDHIIKMFPFVTYFDHPIFWLETCGLAMLIPGVFLATKFSQNKATIPDVPAVELNKA